MSITTACFSAPSPITSNKGIIRLSFHVKHSESNPQYIKLSDSLQLNSFANAIWTTAVTVSAVSYWKILVPVNLSPLASAFPFPRGFPVTTYKTCFRTRLSDPLLKWRERRRSLMWWLLALA